MAKCDLSIELDQPDAVHSGGGMVGGVVRVQVDADVRCKGLEVSSLWRTHGRGNIASETTGTELLFEGEWRAGEIVEYRFELPIAPWPSTYHGHYLNVDHYVDARAKIPWGFDPKASVPFQVRPASGLDEAALERQVTEAKGLVACLLIIVLVGFLVGFGVMLVQIGAFAFLLLVFPILGFLFWLFRVFLPKYVLGEVQHQFVTERVSPGQKATGELVIRPRKNISINGVTMHVQAREQCVSGSGSNRTTHRNVIYEKVDTLQPETTLKAGLDHRFPLLVELPDDAPYSLDLSDNKLIWSATLRVDIPRWPDWVMELPLRVVPSAKLGEEKTEHREEREPGYGPKVSPEPSDDEAADSEITFAETARHLWSVRHDSEQVETLVGAVTDLSFELEAVIERRLLYSGDDDPHVYKDGYAVWARYTDPELPLVMYVPHSLADEFEQVGRDVWRGRGTVVGWDHRHGRLQIKLETRS